jgi:mono/diheme cytochrome c family protein
VLVAVFVGAGCDTSRPDTGAAGGGADGGKVYRLYCTGCHGDNGKRGEGEMVIVNGTSASADELRTIVEQGRGKMPGWKKRLRPDEITAVVEFVQRLQAGAGKR